MIATQALYAAEAGITEGLHRMAYRPSPRPTSDPRALRRPAG